MVLTQAHPHYVLHSPHMWFITCQFHILSWPHKWNGQCTDTVGKNTLVTKLQCCLFDGYFISEKFNENLKIVFRIDFYGSKFCDPTMLYHKSQNTYTIDGCFLLFSQVWEATLSISTFVPQEWWSSFSTCVYKLYCGIDKYNISGKFLTQFLVNVPMRLSIRHNSLTLKNPFSCYLTVISKIVLCYLEDQPELAIWCLLDGVDTLILHASGAAPTVHQGGDWLLDVNFAGPKLVSRGAIPSINSFGNWHHLCSAAV